MVTRINLLAALGAAILAVALFGFLSQAYAYNTFAVDLEKDSSQYLTIGDGDQTGLDLTGDHTVEAWVKFESLGTRPVVTKRLSTTEVSYGFTAHSTHLEHYVTDDGTPGGSTAQTVSWSPSAGVWYHLAVTYDVSSGTVKFYVNGEQQGADQTSGNTSIYSGSGTFFVGRASATSGSYMDGLIDELRVWNDIRTQSEIEDNMYESLTGSESNLVGYWMLSGTTTDATSNGNDLTNNNSASYASEFPYTISCTLPSTAFTGLNFSLDLTCELLGLFL